MFPFRLPSGRRASERLRIILALQMVFGVVFLRNAVMVRALCDDAYIFLRYAGNFLKGYPFAWNPGEGAADGITSPLWLFGNIGVVAFSAWIDRSAETTLKLFLMLMAAFWIFAMYRMGRSAWPKGSRLWPVLIIGLIVFLDDAFDSAARWGMETLLAGAMTALSINLLLRLERLIARNPDGPSGFYRAGFGAALSLMGAVLTRPELVLFAVGAPLLLTWKHRRSLSGKRAFGFCLLAVVFMGALYGGAKLMIFGGLIPWPAYVKSGLTMVYEDYSPQSALALQSIAFDFLRHYCLLLLPLFGVVAHPRLRSSLAWLWAPLLALIVYWFNTLPIMGYNYRYFQPLIPMMVALALLAASRMDLHLWRHRITQFLWPVVVGLIVLSLNWNIWRIHLFMESAPEEKGRISFWGDEPALQIIRFLSHGEPGMTIAATEVGMLSYYNPEARIIDLSGLNTRIFSTGFDPDDLFALRPDVITLVHYDYHGMVRRIVGHPEFTHFAPVFRPEGISDDPEDLSHQIFVDTRSPFYESLAKRGRPQESHERNRIDPESRPESMLYVGIVGRKAFAMAENHHMVGLTNEEIGLLHQPGKPSSQP